MEKIKAIGKRIGIFAFLAMLALPAMAGVSQMGTNLNSATASTGLTSTNLTSLISAAISTILAILGVVLVLYIIYAGWLWMTSGGTDEKVKKAKEMIKNAVVGLLLIMAAYAIASFVISALSGIATGSPTNTF